MTSPIRHEPVYIIAEAGVNHNGSLDLAFQMISAAKKAGADAVKFQSFKADHLVSSSAPKAPYQERTAPETASQYEMIRRLELDEDAHKALQKRCAQEEIVFLSTPFDEASADLLDRLSVPLFKIPSGEITNKPLLRHIASKNKPLLLSTGMSDLSEVADAVGWIRETTKAPLTLLHCLSEYPAPAEQVNLSAMQTLRKEFDLPVGYSDHTVGIEIALASVAMGACVVEKHFTLDRSLPGPDHKASLEPTELERMVTGIRLVESALGDGVKKPAPCERANRQVARRSVVAARDLKKGHRLEAGDLLLKRPGTGIPPAALDSLFGRALKKSLLRDEVLHWEAV